MDLSRPKLFRAHALLAHPDPAALVDSVARRFAEYGRVSVEGSRTFIETGFGLAILELHGAALSITAQSGDETGLAFVKLAMAEHLIAMHPERSASWLVWEGDGAAGAPLPYFREMTVIAARDLTPSMRRLTLRGDDLARFATGGLHVRLLFPPQGCTRRCWPVTGKDGRPRWPDDARPLARIYTIRRIDVAAGEIDIDMVLHGAGGAEGPGARFAAEAGPGDVVGMTGPGAGAVGDARHLLLAGDETALPAIGRILGDLAAGVCATVIIEVTGPAEEQDLPSAATIDVRWLHRGRAEPGTTTLLQDAVRAHVFPKEAGGLFAWVGCEATAFRAIRHHLRNERGFAREQHLAAAYWRRGLGGDEAHGGG